MRLQNPVLVSSLPRAQRNKRGEGRRTAGGAERRLFTRGGRGAPRVLLLHSSGANAGRRPSCPAGLVACVFSTTENGRPCAWHRPRHGSAPRLNVGRERQRKKSERAREREKKSILRAICRRPFLRPGFSRQDNNRRRLAWVREPRYQFLPSARFFTPGARGKCALHRCSLPCTASRRRRHPWKCALRRPWRRGGKKCCCPHLSLFFPLCSACPSRLAVCALHAAHQHPGADAETGEERGKRLTRGTQATSAPPPPLTSSLRRSVVNTPFARRPRRPPAHPATMDVGFSIQAADSWRRQRACHRPHLAPGSPTRGSAQEPKEKKARRRKKVSFSARKKRAARPRASSPLVRGVSVHAPPRSGARASAPQGQRRGAEEEARSSSDSDSSSSSSDEEAAGVAHLFTRPSLRRRTLFFRR